MSKILIKFAVILEENRYDFSLFGPLFNKWLPDGMNDSIVIECDNPGTKVSFWFERYGEYTGSFIRFDYHKKEVDPNIMKRQAVLDGGPLWGLVETTDIKEEEFRAIVQNKIGDESYIKFGKRVVTKVIYPYTKRLLDILSITYGQYWLRELEPWDSSKQSLGSYCYGTLQTYWSTDDGISWNVFQPDRPVLRLNGDKTGIGWDYIKEDDWDEIRTLLNEEFVPSLATSVLNRSHRHFDQGEIRYAFIEAVNALELAMEERVTLKFKGEQSIAKYLEDNRFWKLPMPTKVTILSSMIGNVSIEEVQGTIDAIVIRNSLVHDAEGLPKNAEEKLSLLMKTVSKILVGPGTKFPAMNAGNELEAPN